MPIAQLLELWKKIEVEPMETEVSTEEGMLVLSHGARWTVANGLCSMGGGGVQLLRGGWRGRDVDVLHTCFTYVATQIFLFVCLWQHVVCMCSARMKGTEGKHCCPPPPFSMLPAVCLVP